MSGRKALPHLGHMIMESLYSSGKTVNVYGITQSYEPVENTLCPDSLYEFDHLFSRYKYVLSNVSVLYTSHEIKNENKQVVVVMETFVRTVRKCTQTRLNVHL
jgi:hypothetical protein